jgi:hypothetical protein
MFSHSSQLEICFSAYFNYFCYRCPLYINIDFSIGVSIINDPDLNKLSVVLSVRYIVEVPLTRFHLVFVYHIIIQHE